MNGLMPPKGVPHDEWARSYAGQWGRFHRALIRLVLTTVPMLRRRRR